MFGWYSVKQARVAGTVFYKTPSGEVVEVSSVTKDMDHGSKWDDIACVGEVTEWDHRGSKGELEEMGLTDEDMPLDEWCSKMEALIEQKKKEQALDQDPKRWN